MSGESLDALMQAAAEVARLAGDHALSWYRRGVDVDFKGDGSPVTIADRDAERLAREWIVARFPDDGVLGEELGETRPGARRRWILDPIDGTKAFVAGVPLWGTLVALCEGDDVLAGAAYFPAVGELVAAAPGCGAWWNGARCRASDASSLGSAVVLTTDDRFPGRPARKAAWDALAADARVARTWGDCYGYLLVATGRADVMVDDIVNPWDAAALMPIVTEAGGAFLSWAGVATAFGGDAIACASGLVAEVRGRLGPAA